MSNPRYRHDAGEPATNAPFHVPNEASQQPIRARHLMTAPRALSRAPGQGCSSSHSQRRKTVPTSEPISRLDEHRSQERRRSHLFFQLPRARHRPKESAGKFSTSTAAADGVAASKNTPDDVPRTASDSSWRTVTPHHRTSSPKRRASALALSVARRSRPLFSDDDSGDELNRELELTTAAAAPPLAVKSPVERSVVYFDISCDGSNLGRVFFELFDDICPKTARNFSTLSVGTAGLSSTGRPLHYKGTRFFRIVPQFMIQGGDITHDDGTGGECIWSRTSRGWSGPFFPDENFLVGHDSCGMLSMASEGPDTNQSQFFITCAPSPWLNGRHVAFGRVIRGFRVLAYIEGLGSRVGTVYNDIRVFDCGVRPRK